MILPNVTDLRGTRVYLAIRAKFLVRIDSRGTRIECLEDALMPLPQVVPLRDTDDPLVTMKTTEREGGVKTNMFSDGP